MTKGNACVLTVTSDMASTASGGRSVFIITNDPMIMIGIVIVINMLFFPMNENATRHSFAIEGALDIERGSSKGLCPTRCASAERTKRWDRGGPIPARDYGRGMVEGHPPLSIVNRFRR